MGSPDEKLLPPGAGLKFFHGSAIALTMLFLVTTGILYLVFAHRSEDNNFAREAAVAAAACQETIRDALRLVETIAISPEAQSSVAGLRGLDDPAVMLVLETARQGSRAEIAFLLNSRGTVTASKPLGVPSITGLNFSFRPYFTGALKGQTIIFPALGVATGTRGIYVSTPTKKGGVAVIKFPPDPFEISPIAGISSNAIGLLVSADGVIFAATRAPWRLKTTHPISTDLSAAFQSSRQFGAKPLAVAPFAVPKSGPFTWEGKPWVSIEQVVFPGWSWVTAFPRQSTPVLDTKTRNFFLVLVTAEALLFIIIWLLLYNTHMQRLANAQARVLERDQRARLEALVADRTGELRQANEELKVEAEERRAAEEREREAENALHQAEKMQAIGQLAGGIAHDFNNQLAAMMGYADLIRTTPDTHPLTVQYAEKIIFAARTSADLTTRLLSFARREQFVPQPCDLHGVLEETISLLRHAIDKRITVRCRAEAPQPKVSGNRAQLENVFLNLGLNARDAMPNGGVIEYVTSLALLEGEACVIRGEKLAPGPYGVIRVSDTGTGIDPAVIRHIFEPFFTTKPLGKGTGLGLATVYTTVKAHRGAIAVESTPGRGTTFTVWLPLLDGALDLVEGQAPGVAPGPRRARGRALVVEDEEVVRDLMAEVLSQLGFEVETAPDGRSGVGLFADKPQGFAVVFMDMVMPRLSGKEAISEIRAMNPGQPVVLASGFLPEGLFSQTPGHGPLVHLQKPFSLAAVHKALLEAMGPSWAE